MPIIPSCGSLQPRFFYWSQLLALLLALLMASLYPALEEELNTQCLAGECLAGERVVLIGTLAGLTRREAARLIGRFAGVAVAASDEAATLLVLSDELRRSFDPSELPPTLATAVLESRVKVIGETELWQRVGLIDDAEVRRLYTPAILAELLAVPTAAIRRWHRSGVLLSVRLVCKLPYFDFQEATAARRLADLYHAGCSLGAIDRQVRALSKLLPAAARALMDPALVAIGRQFFIRRGGELAELDGQLLLDFAENESSGTGQPAAQVLSLAAHRTVSVAAPAEELNADSSSGSRSLAVQLRQQALHCEDDNDLPRAAEAYRLLLATTSPTAETHFALADVLYRQGDLAGARERYYTALELDETLIEARLSLGCVLAELGEWELAAAAFEGTLAYHGDYADAHYHLANALDQLGRTEQADAHRLSFLALAPESPWAAATRVRLGLASTN